MSPVSTATNTEVPSLLPVAIAGHAYLIDPAKYQRQSLPTIRQQADASNEPGEQSLSPLGLWRRSQESFHHGAGQPFLDARAGHGLYDATYSDRHRFRMSKGIDCWTEGQLTLLNKTLKVWSSSATNLAVLTSGTPSSGTWLYVVDGQQLYFVLGPGNLLSYNTATMEVSAAGWAAGANTTLARVTSWSYYGTASLQLTATAGGTISANTPTGTSGIPVDPSRPYSQGAAFRAGTTGRVVTLYVDWYDSAGALISTSTTVAPSDMSTGDIVPSYLVYSPAGAAFASYRFSLASAGAGEQHMMDGAFLIPALGGISGFTPWDSAVIHGGGGAAQTPQTVNSVTTDGHYIWAALGTSGIHRTDQGDPGTIVDVPGPLGANHFAHLVGYANGRLLAAGSPATGPSWQRNVLYEIGAPLGTPDWYGATGTTTPLMTHPNDNFVWSFISPGRNCAPGDQMVETANRGRVRIDEIVPGQDRLLCYDPHSQRVFHGKRGQRRTGFDFIKAVRPYSGNLVVMTTDETRARVTPNHRVPVRWARDAATAHCVYLMRRGNWWRIGKSKLHHVGRFGPSARAKTEKADAVWVLGVYEANEQALLAEEYFSAAYGLTQAVFTLSRGSIRHPKISDEMLKDLHERLTAMGSGERARKLLVDLGLEVEYPIWGAGSDDTRCGLGLPFKTRAANIVSGWMEVPVYLDYTTEKLLWKAVTITREPVVEMPVYSLDVEQYHSYVGDGQALFNCIYAGGNAGTQAEIYRITIEATSTALTAPTHCTYLPDGEPVNALQFYAGGIVMGTGLGVRCGVADGQGNIDYGPLVKTPGPVRCLEPQDRYVWFGWTNYDATSTGLGRIDLGYFTNPLVPAWASDLMATGAGDVTSVGTLIPYQASTNTGAGRVFAVAGLGVFMEDVGTSASGKVAAGTLQTGSIRYGTTETKTTRSIGIRHHLLDGTIGAELKMDDGGYVSVGTSSVQGSSAPAAAFPTASAEGEGAEVRFTLNRPTGGRLVIDGVTTNGSTTVTSATAAFTAADVGRTISSPGYGNPPFIQLGTRIVSVTNVTTVVVSQPAVATSAALPLSIGGVDSAPQLTRWTLKSLPVPGRDETLLLPLEMKTNVLNADGIPVPIDIEAEVAFLKGLERTGTIFKLQVGIDTFDAYIEDSSFEGHYFTPPTGTTAGYGPRRAVEGIYTVKATTVSAT